MSNREFTIEERQVLKERGVDVAQLERLLAAERAVVAEERRRRGLSGVRQVLKENA